VGGKARFCIGGEKDGAVKNAWIQSSRVHMDMHKECLEAGIGSMRFLRILRPVLPDGHSNMK
jgi:hypothetical protein